MFHFYNAVFVLVVDFNVMTEVQPAALTYIFWTPSLFRPCA